MLDGSGNGSSCFVVKIWADVAKLTDMWVAGFRQSRYLVRKEDVFVENEAKIKSREGCVKWTGAYFSQLFEFSEKKIQF